MTFADAVTAVFSKYATFSGRARRSEYWWFALFNLIVGIVVDVADAAVLHNSVLGVVTSLALFLPGLAVAVRRLHDTGRTGWWFWILLVPLAGFIVMLVFLCQDSESGINKYGDSPKYPGPQGPYGNPWNQPGPYGPPTGYGPAGY